jgi:hypothetical protein
MERNEIKLNHENAVLSSFIDYCKLEDNICNIIDQPDCPNTVVEINNIRTWIEITDGFHNKSYEEYIVSDESDGNMHKSDTKKITRIETFNSELINVILKKYTKDSIGDVYKEYGKGILLVGLYSPFVNFENLEGITKGLLEEIYAEEEQRFDKIFFYNHEHKFIKFNIEI